MKILSTEKDRQSGKTVFKILGHRVLSISRSNSKLKTQIAIFPLSEITSEGKKILVPTVLKNI